MTLKTYPWDAAEFLETEEDIAGYLSEMLAENDPAMTQIALGDAVRAAGMMKVCKKTGFTRQGIAKATRSPTKPSYETLEALLRALGLTFQIAPIRHAA